MTAASTNEGKPKVKAQ